MFRNQFYFYLSSLTAAIHFSVVLFYVSCTILIFFSEKLKIYAAFFLIFIWILQKIFGGCILTRVEEFFLKKAGKRRDNIFFFNGFAHNFFKRTFRMSLSQINFLFQGMLLVFVFISIIVIILYFIKYNFLISLNNLYFMPFF